MIERLNRTYKTSYRPTNGFDNIDGVLVKLFGNTLFGNHALYRNSIGVI